MAELTDKGLKKALADAKKSAADVYLTEGGKSRGVGRLRFRARPTGDKGQGLFYFRYTDSAGRQDQVAIGVYDEKGRAGLSLKQARDKAGEYSRRYQGGARDLRAHLDHERAQERARIEEARREREEAERQEKTGSLRALLEGYGDYLKDSGKQSAKDAKSLFKRNVFDAHLDLAAMRASSITPGDIKTILEKLVDEDKGRTAAKLRSYMRAAYGLALQANAGPTVPKALREFYLTSNPVAGVSPKPLARFNRARERTLNASELKSYMKALDALPKGMSRDALWLSLLLGGQRPAQVLRLTPIDVDLDDNFITLRDPKGARTQPRVHRLPLVARAADIIKRVHAAVEIAYQSKASYLFTNTGKVPVRLETLSVAVAGISSDMVEAKTARESFELRDIRRTCETMLAGMGVSRDIRAQILSHGLAGVQVRHYDRHDYMEEKRAALLAWDARLVEISEGKKRVDNVVDLHRKPARKVKTPNVKVVK